MKPATFPWEWEYGDMHGEGMPSGDMRQGPPGLPDPGLGHREFCSWKEKEKELLRTAWPRSCASYPAGSLMVLEASEAF